MGLLSSSVANATLVRHRVTGDQVHGGTFKIPPACPPEPGPSQGGWGVDQTTSTAGPTSPRPGGGSSSAPDGTNQRETQSLVPLVGRRDGIRAPYVAR